MRDNKIDNTKQRIKMLKLELDYHLLCLHEALESGDISIQEVEKRRLEDIRTSLYELGYYRTKAKSI